MDGCITSSPGPTPAAARAAWRPDVAELIAMAYFTPNFSQNF